jgi:hypothetical protein
VGSENDEGPSVARIFVRRTAHATPRHSKRRGYLRGSREWRGASFPRPAHAFVRIPALSPHSPVV